MTLQQIRYVTMIAQAGSMNEAAKKLFISQPSLSGAIKELEKEVGIIIFSRTSKGVVLTAEGEEFLGYARQILNQVELLEEKYLEGKGYHFLARNFKRTHGEIDLIMEDGETLVFIEVKSRTNRRYGEPKEAVTPFKQQHIRYTAKAFACSRHIEGRRIRFDVVEVMQMADGTVKFHHIRNAF